MGRNAKPIIFRNKFYVSVKEAARLNHYSESAIRNELRRKNPRKRKRL